LFNIGIFNVANAYYTMTLMAIVFGAGQILIYISLIIAIVGLIGAILGLAGKKAGGALVLIAGVLWLIGGFIIMPVPQLWPLSGIAAWTNLIYISTGGEIFFISIEAILCVLGGMLILAGSSD
ncbi:MAG: hypothetical protein ACFFD2_04595, partial [Promethearchaeota archaeon]